MKKRSLLSFSIVLLASSPLWAWTTRPGWPALPSQKADRIQVYVAQLGGMNKTVTLEDIYSRPGYMALSAVRSGHVLVIDEKLVASPTFRQLEGIELLAAAFDAARADR